MKIKLHVLLILLAVFVNVHKAAAQGFRYFRISGPAPTKINAFNQDGTIVWTNALTGTNYTVQTKVASLLGGTNWVDYVQLSATGHLSTNLIFAFNPPAGMAFIPSGLFTMGDISDTNINNDADLLNVTVSGFYMDANLVTFSQWQSVYAYATSHGYGFVHVGAGKGTNHPVQKVDWYDAVKWSNARSQQSGLLPVYYTDAGLTKVYTNGEIDAVYVKSTANGYRLPTEAEWEKAARGGLASLRFPWGNVISQSLANYYGDTSSYDYDLGPNGYSDIGSAGGSTPATSPVGTFAPNGYGLYDMAGNVLEWCWDWYATPYGLPSSTDPTGSETGIYRVLRGGGWDYFAAAAACACRSYDDPSVIFNDYGFRCVRGL